MSGGKEEARTTALSFPSISSRDSSGVSSDAFDQAVQLDPQGEARLTAAMEAKGIRLLTSVRASITYMGFNMQDPVVGGDSERARLLRRALAIAIDFDEYISIFANGRGVVAQSPLAPGIFGYLEGEAGIDPYVYQWRDGAPVRRPLEEADLSLLRHPAEVEVLKQADRLAEEVREAAGRRAPHRVAAYGQDFAAAFHKFYTDCRIVTDDPALTQARLWLVEGAKSVLLAVLGLLGLSAPDRM